MLIVSLMYLIVISAILIYIDVSINCFLALYLLLVIMSGAEALTYTIGRALYPKGTAGSAKAGMNLINNIVPVILLPLIGHILIQYVSLMNSTGLYTIDRYQEALSIIVVILLITLPFIILLPKHTKL